MFCFEYLKTCQIYNDHYLNSIDIPPGYILAIIYHKYARKECWRISREAGCKQSFEDTVRVRDIEYCGGYISYIGRLGLPKGKRGYISPHPLL